MQLEDIWRAANLLVLKVLGIQQHTAWTSQASVSAFQAVKECEKAVKIGWENHKRRRRLAGASASSYFGLLSSR